MNFDNLSNNLSIDVMKTQVYNAKEFCYIAPVVLNEIGKINVVCKDFIISETYDT